MEYTTTPISHGQAGLWLHHQKRRSGSEYNLPVEVRAEQPFDVAALEQAIATLAERHPVLRTTVQMNEQEVVARVAKDFQCKIDVVEGAAHRQANLLRLIDEAANRPFDLEVGPLFRAHLFQESVLLLNFHHIIADAQSVNVLLAELGELYCAVLEKRVAVLPRPGWPYADFVAWQRELVSSERGEALWRFWYRQLADRPGPLELPTDRPRSASPTYRGAHHPFSLDAITTEAVRGLARKRKITPATVLLGAYAALLHRYSGQDDITVLFPRTGRPENAYERTAGYFVNLGIVRSISSDDPTVGAFLARLRRRMEEHKAHQDLPLPVIAQRLAAEGVAGEAGLGRAVFNFVTDDVSVLGHQPCRMLFGRMSVSVRFCPTDLWNELDLRVQLGPEEARCDILFNADLWDAASIERFARHYRQVLRSFAQDPALRVSQLAFLTVEERQQLLLEWNATQASYPAGACLHELIEAEAEAAPDLFAVSQGDVRLTYAEFNRRANRLAAYLKERGIGAEDVVGLCCERTPDLIVGFLAILKAGGVYLPLDPRNPEDRLEFMIGESGAKVVLTCEHVMPALFDSAEQSEMWKCRGVSVVHLDRAASEIASRPEGNLPSNVEPRNLAYIIYTSGSTGRPKGVMVEHQSVCQRVADLKKTYGLRAGKKVLQFASCGFDASIFDFLLALTNGAELCLPPPEAAVPGQALVDFLAEERINAAGMTPSAWAMLPAADLPALEIIKSGGEPLTAEVVERWGGGRRLFNSYGPTEAAIYAIRCEVPQGTARPLIGRPAANTTAYLLDDHGHVVPVGVPGYLYLGGAGLARGYVARPRLTAEKFVGNPFDATGKGRLYQTGDRARYRPDGSIEFLGRGDDQVKIRGMRVELGEIEMVLASHPMVSSSCAAVDEGRSGDTSIAAYFVPKGKAEVSSDDLRRFLRRKLPEHMVPSVFVELSRLPLNRNGKVDKKALPAPPKNSGKAAGPAPAVGVAAEIARIWCEILNREAVGADDNFFDVGGHSFAMIEVQNRLQQDLGITCSVTDLFTYPTVNSLADFLEPREREGTQARPRPSGAAKEHDKRAEGRAREIAIVGMAGRFPGAESVDELWSNLLAAVEGVADLDKEQLTAAGVDEKTYQDPGFVKREGVLRGVDLFDANLFRIPPSEASRMDPQQRLLLEVAWSALEDAGYGVKEARPEKTGVFVGVGGSDYSRAVEESARELGSEKLQLRILNGQDFTATRIGYKLNLKGPCLSIQTACSTSLVAVHLACQSLRSSECHMALAGGASISLPHGKGYLYQKGHIFSPDGRCRAFDAEAGGTVRGSGAGLVVLKRFEDAQADGDHIWAVIKGSATNNDGDGKVGFAAPSVDGQAAVIRDALADGQIAPQTIGYIEAHGTGTSLGDPIEIAGLSKAFGALAQEKPVCVLGSIKTNVGHLDVAAGVTGLIKAALALHHEQIPATLHFKRPNPELQLEATPFRVAAETVPWLRGGEPRRAGVSSFGIGGTNAHVVVEEAPVRRNSDAVDGYQLLPLSANASGTVTISAQRLAEHLDGAPNESLADVAHTLQTGRAEMTHRAVVVASHPRQAAERLRELPNARVCRSGPERDLVFIYSGQGGQHAGMGVDLYRREATFRDALDHCAELLCGIAGVDFRPLLYADKAPDAPDGEELEGVLQPLLFSIQYAMTQLCTARGLQASAVVGHSIGEYAAATHAGMIPLEDAVRLTYLRGQLSRRLPPGAALAVSLSVEEVTELLGKQLSLAVVNAPSQCLVSGPRDAVDALHTALQDRGVQSRQISTSHAVHSSMLDPVLGELEEAVQNVRLAAPRIPFISTVTGAEISAEEATDPGYWVRNYRQTVRFSDAIELLLEDRRRAFLEIGPGDALTKLVRRREAGPGGRPAAAAAMPRGGAAGMDGQAAFLGALGQLWSAGLRLDWSRQTGPGRRSKVPLPGYPFDRKRYWLAAPGTGALGAGTKDEGMPSNANEDGADVGGTLPSHSAGEEAGGPGGIAGSAEEQVIAVFEEVLGLGGVTARDRFFDLGGDSLAALSVVNRIQQLRGVDLSPGVLMEHQTARDLARALEGERTACHESPLIAIQPKGGLVPLFCPHPYGGHVMHYHSLAAAMGTDQPLFAFQASGLNDGEEPHSSIAVMAASYVDAMRAVQAEGPYYLAGMSMGGCIAWEMASQLSEQGEHIGLVALLDSKARHDDPRASDEDRLVLLGRQSLPAEIDEQCLTLTMLFPEVSELWPEISRQGAGNQVEQLFHLGRQRGIIPEIEEKRLQNLIAVAEAHRRALRQFVPRAHDGRSVLFAAEKGLMQSPACDGHDLGWTAFAPGGLEVVTVPGDHYSMMRPPHVSVLAERLRGRVKRHREQVVSPVRKSA